MFARRRFVRRARRRGWRLSWRTSLKPFGFAVCTRPALRRPGWLSARWRGRTELFARTFASAAFVSARRRSGGWSHTLAWRECRCCRGGWLGGLTWLARLALSFTAFKW